MSKHFWIVLGIIAAVFIGFLLLQGGDKANAPSDGDKQQTSEHVYGNQDADVVLVEYGDYQCPACGQFYPIVEQVKEKYKDDIAFQFRNLPLTQIHPNAFAAARAAEAAAMQDKFWEMYNLLFQNQQSWSNANNVRPVFDQYAEQLELDVEQFKEDFSSSRVNDIINADLQAFNDTGERMSTPTFFLNGEKITPEASVEGLSKLIDEALEKADSSNN